MIMATSQDFKAAKWAAEILNQHGYEAYIVGGAVRDLCLGRKPKDFDLATNARPDQVMIIPEFRQSHYKDTAQAYGVTRVQFIHDTRAVELEIATFRRDVDAHKGRTQTKVEFTSLKEDVRRRDFTINALALNPTTNQIIDYTGGLDDLSAKLVRFIGKPAARISEDPLRILRAIRFKNQLGFFYEHTSSQAMRTAVHHGAIEDIAQDRLRDELTRLLVLPSRRQAILELREFGILERILPEVAAGQDVEQPPEFHAEGNVWQHELLILDYLPANPSKRLVWAALLHDIGKGPTIIRPHTGTERIRFHRHYAVGAEMAKTILRRLRFSNREINEIYWMIYHHISVDDLPAMRPSHQQRMLGHPAFSDVLALHKADASASWRPGHEHRQPEFKALELLWQEYQSKEPPRRQPSLKQDVGIDGFWVMKQFKNDPRLTGPIIGKILATLDEWYRDEGIKDASAYIEKAKEIFNKIPSKPLML